MQILDAAGADVEDDLDAAHDVAQRHRGRAAQPRRLVGHVGNVQEAAARLTRRALQRVHQGVENVVADEGAGGVGHRGGQSLLAQRGHAGLDRQGGEIGRGAIFHHGPVDRLLAVIVPDARILQVDRHAFEAELAAAARLSHAQHDFGLHRVDRRTQHLGRMLVGRRQLGGVDFEVADPFPQPADRERRRIDRVAAERIETRDQCLQGAVYLLAASTARRAITFTRWARYSALPWMSLFRPSAGTLMSLMASDEKVLASASSIALTRNTLGPAPVTATRTLLPALAMNTPTMA